MVRSVKDIKTEEVKKIFSTEDFEKWLKFEDKGRRLGEIVNNTKMQSMHNDATRGMQKLHKEKQRLLKRIIFSLSKPKQPKGGGNTARKSKRKGRPGTMEKNTQKQTEKVNPMCENCGKFGGECQGTTEKVWTGCIYKTPKN